MNANKLLIAINYIDDDLLLEAKNFQNKKSKKKNSFMPAIAIVACFAFIAVLSIIFNILTTNNLPMLDLRINNNDGMGFEGPFLMNPDDFESDNPGKYPFLTSKLPVYENNSHDKKGTPCGLNEKELNETVEKVISALGAKTNNIRKEYANELYGGYEDDFVYSVTAETDIASITANAAGGLTIFFNTPVTLPFDFNEESIEDAEKAAEYFCAVYSELISSIIEIKKPKICISTEYNVYGDIHRSFRVYDSSGNKKDDIINYNLNFAELRIENNGTLTSIYISNSSGVVNEIAQYPIITETKAKEKLISGDYISSVVQYEFPGKEYISNSDLVYKCEKGETIAPYYRFLVELPEAPEANGNKSYGIYYVPAIKEEYISEITLIDGEFQ